MMASSSQYREPASWSCLPCISGGGLSSSGNGPYPSRSRKNGLVHNELKQTEDLLASELSKLSVQERAEAFDDVHCVGEELKETPEMITKSLAGFEEAVQKKRNTLYDIASKQNRAYVEDPSFRLKFLRANMHNVDKSVHQMMSFLQHKSTYFGIDKVARKITLADLNEDDMQAMVSGFAHMQEERDQTGRIILHLFNTPIGRVRVENLLRALHVVFMQIIIPDPSAQMKGFVLVYHDDSKPGENPVMPGIDFMLKLAESATSFPVRYSALHYCLQAEQGKLSLNNAWLRYMINLSPDYVKVRCRIHIGSNMEHQYQLRSHGIPMYTYPVDINGNVRSDILNTWFYKYQQEQSDMQLILSSKGGDEKVHSQSLDQLDLPLVPLGSSESFTVAKSIKPSENDIVSGRGRFVQTWPGNIKFREFVEKHLESYDRLPRNERQKRTIELNQELAAKGVRFFEQTESGEWIEADCAEARKKISQLFRSLRKKR